MISYELLPHEYSYDLYLSYEYDLHPYNSMILNKHAKNGGYSPKMYIDQLVFEVARLSWENEIELERFLVQA
jgi:hypothetical protein